MTTEPTFEDEYNPVEEQREQELRERPPFSAAFPSRSDCYVRFSTKDCIDLCRELKFSGMMKLLGAVEEFDIHAMMLALNKGLKLDDGARRPLIEHMDFAAVRMIVLDALSMRNWNKTYAEVTAESAEKQAEQMKALLG